MKRTLLISGAALALGASGCGWYTNIPAMIHVKSVEPATVTVEYLRSKPESPLTGITAKYTQPTITLEGQPGSIGATFKDMRMAYYRPSTASVDLSKPILTGEQYLKAFVRVEPSTLREDPSKGYLEMKDMPDKRLIIGNSKFVAPVITNEILKLGDPNLTPRDSLIFVRVVLEGEDDARWPFTKEIFIPITFVDSTR